MIEILIQLCIAWVVLACMILILGPFLFFLDPAGFKINIVRPYLLWRWGLRGALKPPIAPTPQWLEESSQITLLWWMWRYFCWKCEAKIYAWSGLSDIWWSTWHPLGDKTP